MAIPLKPKQKKPRGSNLKTQATDKGRTSKSSKSMDMSGAHTADDDQQHDDRAWHDPTQKPTKSRTHNNDEPNKNLDTYSCRFCGKSFKKYEALGGHIGKLHSEEHEEEKLQKPQKLVKKKKQQQLSTSHNSHLSFGGGLATQIPPDPYAPSGLSRPMPTYAAWPSNNSTAYYNHCPVGLEPYAPPGISRPVPTYASWPSNNSTAYYNHCPVGLDHFNMPAQSYPTLNYMPAQSFPTRNYMPAQTFPTRNYMPAQSFPTRNYMPAQSFPTSNYMPAQTFPTRNYMPAQSFPTRNYMTESNSGIHQQHIPYSVHRSEDSNMDSNVNNVPLAHFNMSVSSSPYLTSRMESDPLGNHLEPIPGNSHSNQDSNINFDMLQRANGLQNGPLMPDQSMTHEMIEEMIEEMLAGTSPYLNSMKESDSSGANRGQIPGNSHSDQDRNNVNSGVPQAVIAFENVPMLDSFHELDLADEVVEEKIYHHLSDHIAPNPLHVFYEKKICRSV